jgi:SAM-dependent methyltransferase
VSDRSELDRVDDPAYVRRQYANEGGLAARKSIYQDIDGVDAREVVFAAVAEVDPARVLEVGCGEGELSERLQRSLGVEVIALDQSERMVELTRNRGVHAVVGDVQQLPFEQRSFDVVVAAWMLYHVPDLDRGLAEIARVLRPEGRLVAATNSSDHLREMFELVGLGDWSLPFRGENGRGWLEGYFATVDCRDAGGTVTLHDADAIRTFLGSSERLSGYVARVPALQEPLVVRRRPVVFVADTPL